jgi:hypothetical protein
MSVIRFGLIAFHQCKEMFDVFFRIFDCPESPNRSELLPETYLSSFSVEDSSSICLDIYCLPRAESNYRHKET